jgi:predicted esterase
MLLGGAAVGILALSSSRSSAKSNANASHVNLVIASDDPSLPPLYDIPKLDKITIDGSPADWKDHGLRVDVLANASGKVQPRSDIDASLRLGWNDRGLLALVTVMDDIPLEDANPTGGDSVEMFLSPRVGAADAIRVAIGPGVDPKQPRLRTRVFDLRTDPHLRKTAPTVSAARTRIDGGYIIEALIPWSNLGIKPQVGGEVGFQLQVNDLDASDQSSHLVWYPSLGTARDKSKMHRLRLAAAPSPAVQAAAFGDYPRFHRTRVTVLGSSSMAGKTVEIVRTAPTAVSTLMAANASVVATDAGDDEDSSDSTKAAEQVPLPAPAPQVLVSGKMEGDFVRSELSSANLSLPMPARGSGYGTLDVMIDGKRVGVVDLPDPGISARWILPYQEFVFKPCVFSTRAFPEGDFEDPSYVEDLIGSYEAKITFYDAACNVVTTAENPGRYGAVIEVRTEDGQTFKRFRTLFREPRDFSWRNTDIPFTVKLPKEMGISSDALKVQQRSVSTYFKELLKDEGVNRDSDTAVLLAGLFETKSADKSLLSNSPPAMDRAWWAGLKKKIGEPVIKHLLYLPPAYGKAPDQQWPLILFLHGKGERGDNLDQIKEAALPSRLEYDNGFRRQFPAIVVAPQCPAGEWWSTNELAALLDEVQAKYRVDPNRVYVTGLSMGGYGTWALATAFPDRFAAIAPVCGGGDPADLERLAHLPIWAFHGRKDDIVPYAESERMITALEALGADVKLTTYPNARHDAWTETYANPELYTWLFSHARSTHIAPCSAPLVAGTVTPTTLPSH